MTDLQYRRMMTGYRPPCDYCESDSHTSSVRPSVQQLRGKNLCQHHLDTAVTIGGHLLSPDVARETESLRHAE